MKTPTLDNYSRQVYTEDEAINALMMNPDLDLHTLTIDNVDNFNSACEQLYIKDRLTKNLDLDCLPEEFHKLNQSKWHMPEEYFEFDIAKWCLDRCDNNEQLQRVGKELLMYQDRDLFSMLKFLHYMVSVMRDNNIVWGIGRGSSVASYVLYLIGIHKIDSLFYDLDVEDFLR